MFAACTVAKISLDQIVRHLAPFVGVVLACLMLITYLPGISLTLRDAVYPRQPAVVPSVMPSVTPAIGPVVPAPAPDPAASR